MIQNGVYISYYENGNLREKGFYKNGKLNGVFYEYDENGKLIVESHWKSHKLEGKLTRWRDIDLGILAESTVYKNDFKVHSSLFDEESRIIADYYYDSWGRCVECIEYKRKDGFVYIAKTKTEPLIYTEEVVKETQ